MELLNISTADIDKLYEYKKRVEEDTEAKEPIEIEKFLDDYIRQMKHVFFCAATQEAIAFNIYKINDKDVCFHTDASETAMTAFIEECDAVEWKIPKQKPITEMIDVVADGKNFFIEY